MLTTIVEYEGDAFPVLAPVLSADHDLRIGLVATRDRRRGDPEEMQRYAAVKRGAIAAGQTTPWVYQQAKTPYLQALAARDSS